MSDRHMTNERRMTMERCLTSNFLLKFGEDVFGKRDLLYVDMRGSEDVARMYDMQELPDPRQPKEAAEWTRLQLAGEYGGEIMKEV